MVCLELFDCSLRACTEHAISSTGQISRVLEHILYALYNRATHSHFDFCTNQ